MRSITVITNDILGDWKQPSPAAAPYLKAMHRLNSIDDKYGDDSARSIINYFLVNAIGWRGEVARRVKTELKTMINGR